MPSLVLRMKIHYRRTGIGDGKKHFVVFDLFFGISEYKFFDEVMWTGKLHYQIVPPSNWSPENLDTCNSIDGINGQIRRNPRHGRGIWRPVRKQISGGARDVDVAVPASRHSTCPSADRLAKEDGLAGGIRKRRHIVAGHVVLVKASGPRVKNEQIACRVDGKTTDAHHDGAVSAFQGDVSHQRRRKRRKVAPGVVVPWRALASRGYRKQREEMCHSAQRPTRSRSERRSFGFAPRVRPWDDPAVAGFLRAPRLIGATLPWFADHGRILAP